MAHQHEAWMLDVSAATGGLYCKACGNDVPATADRLACKHSEHYNGTAGRMGRHLNWTGHDAAWERCP